MKTALVAYDAQAQEAAALIAKGDSCYAEAGALLLNIKEQATAPEYRLALREAGIAPRTARRMIQFAGDPEAHERHVQNQRNYRKRAVNVDRIPTNEIKEVVEPAPTLVAPNNDGLHEARQGFKAAARRYHNTRTEPRKAIEWRRVALAHFQFMLERSNLPQIAGMSVTEIIEALTL